jgi:hypothetical protein
MSKILGQADVQVNVLPWCYSFLLTNTPARYIMSMVVSDYSGQMWFQGFNDVGETVFGMKADELMELKVRGPRRCLATFLLMDVSSRVTAENTPVSYRHIRKAKHSTLHVVQNKIVSRYIYCYRCCNFFSLK